MTCGTRKTGGTKLLFSNFQPTENLLTFELFGHQNVQVNYFNLVLTYKIYTVCYFIIYQRKQETRINFYF